MSQPNRPTMVALSVLTTVAAVGVYLLITQNLGQAESQPPENADQLDTPFNGERSYQFLKDICAIGRRISGSEGMARQQKLLADHFTALGGAVTLQKFNIRHPETGENVTMANMIVQWHPERNERILLCAHYDTRPFPDEDRPDRRRGVFIGANDGASGAAFMAEMAHHMPGLKSKYGVDFVLFDGEEFIFDDYRDKYFLGSQHFADRYVAEPPAYRYRWGVLLDMIGDAQLQIYQERNSLRFARPLVKSIWNTAKEVGVSEFIARARHEVRDDHLPLNQTAGIPTCDLIDFDYPSPSSRQSYWHTVDDTPDKCSADSLKKVGAVLLRWFETAP